jgi:hypothetical protein
LGIVFAAVLVPAGKLSDLYGRIVLAAWSGLSWVRPPQCLRHRSRSSLRLAPYCRRRAPEFGTVWLVALVVPAFLLRPALGGLRRHQVWEALQDQPSPRTAPKDVLAD